jgi:adenylate cyclase
VVMITASGEQQKLRALEAGADDFVLKPFDQAELLARVQSLLRIKAYQDTIQQQAVELADWSRRLEQRVDAQVVEIERLGSLRRFLSPQLADVISGPGGERQLESHRREITVVFFDLRNFTAFAETAAPEDVMSVLHEYHAALGSLIFQYEGTLERFTGDGIMVFFNDPVPCPDPTARAVRLSVTARERVRGLMVGWRKLGYELHLGVGIAAGFATLGRIGFEGRFDYAAIGPVTNLAARLCGEAGPGQILISQRAHAAVEDLVDAELVGDLLLKGFARPVPTYSVLRLQAADPNRADVDLRP